ncbi:hypothetical protein ACFWM1_28435 [Nocardia sp. NPDC058379]|uniref:hypothetical protein n=1 Tax=unclassified Nocardia TaxID=2637762 RepID=UPI003660941D
MEANLRQPFEEKLSELGFQANAYEGDEVAITLVDTPEYGYLKFSISQQCVPLLVEQLNSNPQRLPNYHAFAFDTGVIEFAIRLLDRNRRRQSRTLVSDSIPCAHPRRPVNRDRDVYVHVTDPESRVCLEISNISPAFALLSIEKPRPSHHVTAAGIENGISLKVLTPTRGPHDKDSIARAESLAVAFFYELSARNSVPMDLVVERVGRYCIEDDVEDGPYLSDARFPRTRIGSEVAQIFSFAEGARQNPLLAFLSYYQVLEYFFPYAGRRHTIHQVRKELADIQFTNSDQDILRIISVAEGATRSSEADQITILLRESVREDRLLEFFQNVKPDDHFGKSKTIKGVETINPKNPHKPLLSQVADRVYQLRNRIVHAKDDPRYDDAKFILPKSPEAKAIGPDVELVRLLAIEVITDSQLWGRS